MTPRIYGFTGNVQSFATRFGPDPFIGSYLRFNYYSFLRWYCSCFPKTTFPISDHFIIQCPISISRPALLCKKLTFRKLKNIDLKCSQLILPLLCFVQAYNGTTLMHSPTALIKPLLTCWIGFPHLKQGLWLIVQRSHGLMMTFNNSSVNVVALKREPWKLTCLVTGIIIIKFVISTLHFLNLHVWIIIQT